MEKTDEFIVWDKKFYRVKKIIDRWEEHTLGKPWWSRKHRVYYEVLLENDNRYRFYWDRGTSGRGEDWFLVEKFR